jgi:hypothetical protein
MRGKLQAPTSKLQRKSNLQDSTREVRAFGDWRGGDSLDVGGWMLELGISYPVFR